MNSYVPEQNTNLAMTFGTCYSLHINLLGKPDSNWSNFSWIKRQTNSWMPLTRKPAGGLAILLRCYYKVMTTCWISKPKHQCWIRTTISALVKVIVNAISKSPPIWTDTGKAPVCCNLSKTATKHTVPECAHTHSEGRKVWQTQGRHMWSTR